MTAEELTNRVNRALSIEVKNKSNKLVEFPLFSQDYTKDENISIVVNNLVLSYEDLLAVLKSHEIWIKGLKVGVTDFEMLSRNIEIDDTYYKPSSYRSSLAYDDKLIEDYAFMKKIDRNSRWKLIISPNSGYEIIAFIQTHN